MKKFLTRRRYEMVYGGDERGWLIHIRDEPITYWGRQAIVNVTLDVLGHPCCSPPNGSEFWYQFNLPDWVHTALFYFDNWPLKHWYKNFNVLDLPLTSEQAYKIDPEFYNRMQKELAEQEAEDVLES